MPNKHMEPTKIGDEFLQKTKYTRGKLSGSPLDWQRKPETYKIYSNTPIFSLPTITELNNHLESQPLLEILKHRQSIRQFENLPINIHQLSYLL